MAKTSEGSSWVQGLTRVSGESDVTVTRAHGNGGATARSTWVKDWALQAVCYNAEPDALFVAGAAQQVAKRVCRDCFVVAECLAESLDNHTEFGVWGGMTERERRALLERCPGVASWRVLFEADRISHQQHAS
jgi:WhiB family redox-sensing transcriptional regulator